jgi:hypothetical protein
MNRSSLYAVIAVLVIGIVAIGGYMLYQQSQQPKLEIQVDGNGIRIDGNG